MRNLFLLGFIAFISCKSKSQRIKEELAADADKYFAEREKTKLESENEDANRITLLMKRSLEATDLVSDFQIISGKGLKKTTSHLLIDIKFINPKLASLSSYILGDVKKLPEGKLEIITEGQLPINYSLIYIKPQIGLLETDYYKVTSNSIYEFMFVLKSNNKGIKKKYSHIINLYSGNVQSEVPQNPEDYKESFTLYCNLK